MRQWDGSEHTLESIASLVTLACFIVLTCTRQLFYGLGPVQLCADVSVVLCALQEMGLEDFIFSHPAQISLLGIQFQWTADTQAALMSARTDKAIMSRNMKKTDNILREMVSRSCNQWLGCRSN